MTTTKKLCLYFSMVHLLALHSCKQSNKDVYKDAQASVDERIESLLAQMTLEEKIEQLAGHGLATDSNIRLGIPGLLMSDGPIGVRTGKATVFPAGVALGASWDTALVAKVAKAIAVELKAKGLNMILGPCMDLQRFPAGGRNFETYSEDPFLNGTHAVAYINAAQNEGVIACAKHYACENIQWERFTLNQIVEERALREIFFVPFEKSVKEAKVKSVMASYYKINGLHSTENPFFLNEVLKGEWGFNGFVVSDWDATHSTVAAAKAGLDVEMPQPIYFGDSLLQAVKQGLVSEEIINDKVRRVLRAKFEAGLFDKKLTPNEALVNNDNHKALALEAAENGMVLLKNDKNILPLNLSKIKTIAVIGPNAAECRASGGGSSEVVPFYTVSPLDGLKEKLKNTGIKIEYAMGDKLEKNELAAIPANFFFTDETRTQQGLKAEYFDNIDLKGQPKVTRIDPNIDYVWYDGTPDPSIPADNFGVRWTGVLVSPVPATFKICTFSDDGVRLCIDGKLLIENWDFHGTEKDSVEIFLDQNTLHTIKLEYFDGQMGANIKLAWDYNTQTSATKNGNMIKEAVAAAKKADVAVVFVGLTNFLEGEARDVDHELNLPGNQEALIKAVAKANPNTIVVMNGGVPLNATGWINQVAGFIHGFYLGERTGDAIANVLTGEVNPSAKLPFTYIKSWKDSPTYDGYKGSKNEITFKDGIYVGYRYYDKNKVEPLYPFGYGLSYTSFSYSNLEITPLGGNKFTVSFEIENTGSRAGKEIAQVYVKDVECSVDRPEKELKGFVKVALAPKEKKKVSVTLTDEAFRFYSVAEKSWKIEPGEFQIMVGSSVRDIKLQSKITM